MENFYEVVLTHKEKLNVPADSASKAIEIAMQDVANRKLTFEPTQWAVKETVKDTE